MDVVRSCRKGKMRFDPERPNLLTSVEWFFCQPGAKIFPAYHRFATANYDDYLTATDLSLGMVPEAGQSWVDGVAPPIATGQKFCGPIAKFQQGVDLVNGPVVVRDAWGIPACCYPGGVIPLHGFILQEDLVSKILFENLFDRFLVE